MGRAPFTPRPPRSRVKVEYRRGLYEGRWLTSFHQNPPGLYGYLQLRKPFGADCVPIVLKFVAVDFGVERSTIRAWLDGMAELGLLWAHRIQNGLCVHLDKAGDHVGNDWLPAPRTHQDRRPESGSGKNLASQPDPEAGKTSLPNDSEAGETSLSKAVETSLPEASLYLAPVDSSPESSPSLAATRAPDGARGEAVPCPDEHRWVPPGQRQKAKA